MVSYIIITLLGIFMFFFLHKKFNTLPAKTLLRLPPGPPGLPVIGNLHELDTSNLPDYLWRLSKRYGSLMSLRIGLVQTLVVSSAEMAKQVLKTNDLIFCNRPVLTGQQKLSYYNKDIAFAPYNEYWRQMRKTCTLHLLSAKQVNSFRPIREEEVFDMIDTLKARVPKNDLVNLSETLMVLTSNIISRMAFGKRTAEYDDEQQEVTRFSELILRCQSMFAKFFYRDIIPFMGWLDIVNGSVGKLEKIFKDMDEFYQELIDEHENRTERPNNMQEDMVDILLKLKQDSDCSVELTYDHIKGVLMNIMLGGTETSATTVVWAMTMLMMNPESLKKLQQEVRNAIGNKGKVHEHDLYKLDYLKAVIKEAYRLYPTAPLLVPRESRDRCVLNGYEIPKKILVYVNVWAIGRDPKCWEKPEVFDPERFMGSSVDYKGTDFGLIPFGSGRRGCPGMSLGATTVELTLANLVYSFDWEMPKGTSEIDTLTTPGTVARKKNDLSLVAKVFDHGCKS